MARDARWDALLELVGKHGRVEVEEAAAALAVSAATIRRDLDQLAEQHLLTRTRGGRSRTGSRTNWRSATRPAATPLRSRRSAARSPDSSPSVRWSA